MRFSVDLMELDRFLSTLEEELREISRLEGILDRQRALFPGLPEEEARTLEQSRFLSKERERVQNRKAYIMKVQELLSAAEKENDSALENALQQIRLQNQ